jgi:hypothetical protein
MAFRTGLSNFSKGEISPEVAARFDLPVYQAGLRKARNVKIKRTGGVSKRMGTRFVVETDEGARLFPFQFSDEQAYALLFKQAAMQPLALGGAVLDEELQVIGITNAPNAKINVHYHAYTVGQKIYLKNITGMDEINDRVLTVVSVVDANNFTVNIDTSTFGAFTGSGGGTDRIGAPSAPPTPPTVPTPTPTPTPPTTTDPAEPTPRARCVDWNEAVLLANGNGPGDTKLLRHCEVGDLLWTQHETSREWGAHPIEAISFADCPVLKAAGYPRATALHRFGTPTGWVRMQEIGEPDGTATVALVTVKDAHTYVTVQPDGRRVLNHNLKPLPGDDPYL